MVSEKDSLLELRRKSDGEVVTFDIVLLGGEGSSIEEIQRKFDESARRLNGVDDKIDGL